MLQQTKLGLETGLCVRHITTYGLETCDIDDDTATVLDDPRLRAFDCIPVRDNGDVVGCLWRAQGLAGTAKRHMQPISERLLVSADLPLTQFMSRFADAPHRLVLDGASIAGIVTWSDLQKLPVRLFIFSLITYLEMVMAQTISAQAMSESQWLQLVSEGRRDKIEQKRLQMQRRNLEPPLVELTDFADKRDILRKRLALGGSFERQLKAIEELRNTTDHAGSYAESPEAVQRLVQCLRDTEHWIDYFVALGGDSSTGS